MPRAQCNTTEFPKIVISRSEKCEHLPPPPNPYISETAFSHRFQIGIPPPPPPKVGTCLQVGAKVQNPKKWQNAQSLHKLNEAHRYVWCIWICLSFFAVVPVPMEQLHLQQTASTKRSRAPVLEAKMRMTKTARRGRAESGADPQAAAEVAEAARAGAAAAKPAAANVAEAAVEAAVPGTPPPPHLSLSKIASCALRCCKGIQSHTMLCVLCIKVLPGNPIPHNAVCGVH